MNAGMKQYEIFNNLLFIKTKKEILQKQDIDFGYRYAKIDDIIIEASFLAKKGFDFQKTDMFKNLRKNQPKNPNAGSCFKNPPKNFAGELIEKVGLKGKKMGGMAFSPLHANFLVNLDNGSFEDAITLINEAKKRVFEQFGIMLELEIKILDKDFL
jgi:UDP-N-acetylmuramate dehydrogenase